MHQAVFVDGTTHLLNWLGYCNPINFTTARACTRKLMATVDETATTMATGTTINLYRLKRISRGFAGDHPAGTGIQDKRGYLYRQFLKDEAVITQGGSRWINVIHRDDVVSALVTALNIPRAFTM